MKLRPIHKDVLIRHVPERQVKESPIFYRDDPDEMHIQNFEIVEVSPTVTLVSVGDIVMVNWKNMTEKFKHEIDGEEHDVAITDENQIEAIVEYE